MSNDLHDTRREYDRAALTRRALTDDPHDLFARWLDAAIAAELTDATAMTLATVSASGQPHARIVLLKSYDAAGFVFFTDYGSEKGSDLAATPRAELLFYWREFERQVRVSGSVTKISAAESQRYFERRPEESRASAIASHQSQPIASREALEQLVRALDSTEEKPERWGGYRLEADRFEFWQGRSNRLHDRFRYTKTERDWVIDRLMP